MNEGKYLIVPISDTGREMCFSVGISGFYQDVPKSHANDIAVQVDSLDRRKKRPTFIGTISKTNKGYFFSMNERIRLCYKTMAAVSMMLDWLNKGTVIIKKGKLKLL